MYFNVTETQKFCRTFGIHPYSGVGRFQKKVRSVSVLSKEDLVFPREWWDFTMGIKFRNSEYFAISFALADVREEFACH